MVLFGRETYLILMGLMMDLRYLHPLHLRLLIISRYLHGYIPMRSVVVALKWYVNFMVVQVVVLIISCTLTVLTSRSVFLLQGFLSRLLAMLLYLISGAISLAHIMAWICVFTKMEKKQDIWHKQAILFLQCILY